MRKFCGVAAFIAYNSAVGLVHSHNHSCGCGLATARFADKPVSLIFSNRKRNIVHGVDKFAIVCKKARFKVESLLDVARLKNNLIVSFMCVHSIFFL